jgi:hypothetical protein
VHTEDRRAAEAAGYVLAAETVLPRAGSVLIVMADGGVRKWPSCDGRWLDEHEAAEPAGGAA